MVTSGLNRFCGVKVRLGGASMVIKIAYRVLEGVKEDDQVLVWTQFQTSGCYTPRCFVAVLIADLCGDSKFCRAQPNDEPVAVTSHIVSHTP